MGNSSDEAVEDTLAATGLQGDEPARPRLRLAGYEIGDTLGQGGMGEVLLARDAKIGRDVAIKRLRHAEPGSDALDRFMREAKIQARLDHPAIVPVHELGEDQEGRPYFTMKRLAGTTLADELAKPDATLQRLLRAFVDVCLAIDFAHARGVVHRDLKPSNIMLGDYGEVYVLDWGIARVVGEAAGARMQAQDISTLEGQTQAGALLGTPGYMSPEQVRGEDVTPATDVYSLGCVLFELLVGEPLHPRGTQGALASTLAEPQQAPGKRKPDRAIAPELDAACTAALAGAPAERPTARALGDRIQAYLDGDRDVERRRKLAADETAAAIAASATPAGRAEAIRRAGRALVLDPDSKDATALVLQLLLEPPAELPAQLERQLASQDLEHGSRTAAAAALATASYFAFIPLILWAGVRDWWLFGVVYSLVGFMCVVAWLQARSNRPLPLMAIALNLVLNALMSRLLSPWIFGPAIVCVYTMTVVPVMQYWRRRVLVGGASIVSLLLPVALEALGVLHRTWWVEGGQLHIESNVISVTATPTVAFLIAGYTGLIIVCTLFSSETAKARDLAHRQVEIQAWHLRQLLPVDAPLAKLPSSQWCQLS